jgi:hypothetical protein
MVMHLAIALVTYNCLVRIATVQPPATTAPPAVSGTAGRPRPRGE